MGLLSKLLTMSKRYGTRVAHPIFSVWTDEIVELIDFETKYKYGKVSFQLRKDKSSGAEYLMMEHRGPEGVIWVPIVASDAKKLSKFLMAKFDDEY